MIDRLYFAGTVPDCRGLRVDDDDRDHAGFYMRHNAKLTGDPQFHRGSSSEQSERG